MCLAGICEQNCQVRAVNGEKLPSQHCARCCFVNSSICNSRQICGFSRVVRTRNEAVLRPAVTESAVYSNSSNINDGDTSCSAAGNLGGLHGASCRARAGKS